MKTRPNLTYEEVIRNNLRDSILRACQTPHSIRELENILKVNRGTLKHHIKILEEASLVKRTYIENKRGQPTQLKTLSENWKRQDKQRWKDLAGKDKDFIKRHKTELIKILSHITPGIEEKELLNKLADDFSLPVTSGMLLNNLSWKELIEKKIYLTDKGKQFLKENK